MYNDLNKDLDFTLEGLDISEVDPGDISKMRVNEALDRDEAFARKPEKKTAKPKEPVKPAAAAEPEAPEEPEAPQEPEAVSAVEPSFTPAPAQEPGETPEEAPEEAPEEEPVEAPRINSRDEDEYEDEEDVERPKKSLSGGIIALLVLIGVLVVAAVAAFFLYKDMYIVLQSELGTGLPEARYYMRDGSAADYVDAPEISLREEQFYLLTVDTGSGTRKVGLLVKDTSAPVAEDAHLSVVYGKHVNPCDVLTTVYDASDWLCRWVQEPDYDTIGTSVVSVELKDSYGNSTVIPATVEILTPVQPLTWSLNAEETPTADLFLVDPEAHAWFGNDFAQVDWTAAGTYPVTVYVNGTPYETEVTVG